jgi:predicted transposase/invertase (TIGR01784 family)
MRRKNDILLKSAFEEAFPDLLRFYFEGADRIFDIERGFEFLDKELNELFPDLEKKGGSRVADMLVKTFLLNGKEEWVLVHLEIQGEGVDRFAFRMFQYWYRIYDRYGVDIAALVVFTGGKKQSQPNYFHKDFLGTEILYKYNTYHILDNSEAELLAMNNPFALIVLAAQKALLIGKIPEEELGEQRLTIARALIQSKKYNNQQISRFLYFLKTFIRIENPEININFEKHIELLTGKTTAMGIIETIKMLAKEEGIEEGMEKGIEKGIEKGELKKSYEFVLKLLEAGKFTVTEIANFASVSEAFVQEVEQENNK